MVEEAFHLNGWFFLVSRAWVHTASGGDGATVGDSEGKLNHASHTPRCATGTAPAAQEPPAEAESAAAEREAPDSEAASSPPVHLRSLNLAVNAGELLAVVGPVGAGKSSLLSACIGELQARSHQPHSVLPDFGCRRPGHGSGDCVMTTRRGSRWHPFSLS